MNIIFRESKKEEISTIKELIQEFSVYVNGSDTTNIDEKSMINELFETKRAKHLFIECDGKIAGYMVYFYIFSTFKGRCGIYLEDVYVKEEFRQFGIGTKAFEYLKAIVKENNYCRLEWNCLNTNVPAFNFYKEKLKAEPMDDLTFFTIEEERIN